MVLCIFGALALTVAVSDISEDIKCREGVWKMSNGECDLCDEMFELRDASGLCLCDEGTGLFNGICTDCEESGRDLVKTGGRFDTCSDACATWFIKRGDNCEVDPNYRGIE
jgi:hypothetical protein